MGLESERKFVGACIHSNGQFAVVVFDHKNIYLFDDIFAATDFMDGHPEYRLHDLADEPVQQVNLTCGNIKSQSDYEDRQWERRQRRQARAQGTS